MRPVSCEGARSIRGLGAEELNEAIGRGVSAKRVERFTRSRELAAHSYLRGEPKGRRVDVLGSSVLTSFVLTANKPPWNPIPAIPFTLVAALRVLLSARLWRKALLDRERSKGRVRLSDRPSSSSSERLKEYRR